LISYLGIAVNHFQTPEQLVNAALVYASLTQDPPYPDEVIEEQALDIWDRYREPPDDPDQAEEYLHVETLDKIQMRAVSFLWKPYLQKSAFHLLVGRKGAGKGSVLAWIAANFTVGFEAPDGSRADPKDVLWIATEDSFEIDVKPRIVAQGGIEKRLWAVRQAINLPRDLPAIRAFCEKHDVGLVVIDPIVGVIGDADTNSEGPIVAAIGGLNQLADELDLSVIGVRHTGKNMDAGMLSSVLGSVAWVNTPRAVLGIKQDEEKQVSLEVIASNRVRSTDRTWFRLEEAKVQGLKDAVVSKVVPLR
jgi:RecA-family ATPase